jgi:ferrous iron transport protein A
MIDLSRMGQNETGQIVKLQGGYGLTSRLEAMGIRVGVTITKKSAQLMRGPIIAQVGNTQVAIGFGMARKIMVEVSKE